MATGQTLPRRGEGHRRSCNTGLCPWRRETNVPNEEQVRAIAQAFANALDRNDFECAAAMLAPGCRYDLTRAALTSEGTLLGPEAIVQSYERHNTRAHVLFDRVEYFSAVENIDGTTALIRFSDVIEKGSERHTYSCRQRVVVNESGLIDQIVQFDIPEETTAVLGFLRRVGVSL